MQSDASFLVSIVSDVAVTRTVAAIDLAATSALVLGVSPDGLTTFRVFGPDEVGGPSTSISTGK
jgi:hypothetical protein